ncbi:branched-chain amino acid transport system II carrier protein [Clostridium rectalis]|uniref:branched-chain amino acid transport system II carrier protein n=1 Tax=Clostridium rectalis TaxID=2040295 RepID=UPI000F63CDC7|nr:branched-chain amino acid transport system II carrier protein [Clostridium rectalis]
MEKGKTRLSTKVLFLMGGALFAMHFGGSSMIWPMTWGKESGQSILPAFVGVYLTALFFPLLAYVALSKAKGTFYQVSERVSPKFAKIFCSIAMLVLGPLFCIPRMSAAAWDAFLQVSGFQSESIIAPLIFSIMYYLITYWFIAQKSDAVDKVSKILFPVLVIAVIAIIAKGIFIPISSIEPKTYNINSFSYGFKNGYATGELLCALVYATIIIEDLKFKGIDNNFLDKNLIKVGLVGIGLLTLTHLGHMIVGAFTGSAFGELKYAALYSAVVLKLWGNVGGIIFNIALLFAALTTAIGLSVATANYFQELTKDKVSYNNAAIITLIISAIVSTIGLTTIVELAAPLLDIVYPAAIVLTLFYALIPNLDKNTTAFSSYKFAIFTAFIWGIYEGILTYMAMFKIDAGVLQKFHDVFPLTSQGLGWITITFIAAIIGAIINKRKGLT